MLASGSENVTATTPRQHPVARLLRGLDIVAQIALAYVAWTSLGFAGSGAADVQATMLRLPLVMWQLLSLVLSSIAYEGIAGRSFHARMIWPVLGSLVICAGLVPLGVGSFLLWLWFQTATLLSIPYLIITIVMFFRYSGDFVLFHESTSVRRLFLLKQTDLVAQLLCLGIPLLITLRAQQPIGDTLILAYPFLTGWQLISAAFHTCRWREMTPWRSGLRIPQMFLQAIFGAAVLIQLFANDRFSLGNAIHEPCAQMLVTAYLLISYHEWEKLSAGVAFQRRAAAANHPHQSQFMTS